MSATEVQSISATTTKIVKTIQGFADRHGAGNQFDSKDMKRDTSYFLVERGVVNLRELRVSILEDGEVQLGNIITGKRRADLIIRLHYKGGVYRK